MLEEAYSKSHQVVTRICDENHWHNRHLSKTWHIKFLIIVSLGIFNGTFQVFNVGIKIFLKEFGVKLELSLALINSGRIKETAYSNQ